MTRRTLMTMSSTPVRRTFIWGNPFWRQKTQSKSWYRERQAAALSVYVCGRQLFRGCGCRLLGGDALESHLIFLAIAIDTDLVAGQNSPFEDLQSQRILNQALNRATKRACAIGRIVTFAQEQLLGCRSELQRDLAFGEQLVDALEHEIDDALQLLFAERIEDHDFVDAVDEFGPE